MGASGAGASGPGASSGLAGLGALGPAFAAGTHRPGARPEPPWRPFAELLDTPAWHARTVAVRAALASMAQRPADEIEARVALATAHLGVVARVLAPAFALAVTSGEVLAPGGTPAPGDVPGPGGIWWQPLLGGPPPLSLPDAVVGVPAGELAAAFGASVGGLVAGVTDAAARVTRLSPVILRDNGASAINSAAGMLAAARPDLADHAAGLASGILRQPPWELSTAVGARFRRESCCLIYRAGSGPPRPVCGDCVLGKRR